jgi:hypothetical protein
MKSRPKPPRKHIATGKKRGGAAPRNSEGLTPKQRLDSAKADAQEFINRREREKWQTREEYDKGEQEKSEMIQADLYARLPSDLQSRLSGKVFTPAEVRAIVRECVDAMVREWVKGGAAPEASIPA